MTNLVFWVSVGVAAFAVAMWLCWCAAEFLLDKWAEWDK